MKRLHALGLLAFGMLAAPAFASSSSYDTCTTAGCKVEGTAAVTTTYAQTKYPILLANGLFGFSAIGPIDYWYGIPQAMAAQGASVFETGEASSQSNEVRGEQLLAQAQMVMAITGAKKVNLIGHSQGGPTVRYVGGVDPAIVASVTVIGSPNFGTPVADDVAGLTTVVGTAGTSLIASAINDVFGVVDLLEGAQYQQNVLAALQDLTTPGMTAFNAQFPAGAPSSNCGQGANLASNGVYYYSWGGTGHFTNLLAPSDAGLALLAVLIPGPSDDLVPQCSNHWGLSIRDNYNMNHLDEVNQVLGLVSPFETSPVTLMLNQANRLKQVGL